MAKRRQSRGLPRRKDEQAESSANEKSGRFGLGKPLTEYKTRAEREAAIQKRVIWGVSIILGIVIVLVLITLIYEQIIKPSQSVAEVNGFKISAVDFENRVRFERLVIYEKINTAADLLMQSQGLSDIDAANQALGSNPVLAELSNETRTNDQIGLRVLGDMIADRLVQQEAEARGITVTQEDINKEFEKLLGFDSEANTIALDPERTPEVEPSNTPSPTPFVSPTPRPTATATPTPESTGEATEEATTPTALPTVSSAETRTPELNKRVFENNLERFYAVAKSEANYTRTDVDAYFEMQALRTKLAEAVIEGANTEEWVNARRIVVATEEEAQQVLDALNAGQPFTELAEAVSIDTQTASSGELFALPYDGVEITPDLIRQQLGIDQSYLDALRDGQPGELIGPVDATLTNQDGSITPGYQVIQIVSREDRDLTPDQVELKRDKLFESWLIDLRDQNADVISTNDNWPNLVPTGPEYATRSVR
jgi:parvulin-like peptidyl-prolyl isomerase